MAWLTIFIRSCFRVAELRGGFGGALANDQGMFIALESTMVAIAALALTVPHPSFVFGRFWKMRRASAVLSPAVDDERGSDTTGEEVMEAKH